MDWLVVVCDCGRGELFRYGLSVLNNCGGVSWMRCGGGWSGFVFYWGELEFVSSSFLVLILFVFLILACVFRWSSTTFMIDNSALS